MCAFVHVLQNTCMIYMYTMYLRIGPGIGPGGPGGPTCCWPIENK